MNDKRKPVRFGCYLLHLRKSGVFTDRVVVALKEMQCKMFCLLRRKEMSKFDLDLVVILAPFVELVVK
jgi:hypothetical protein